MKTIAIHLRLETASHRKRMLGVFRFAGARNDWDIRIIPTEDALCRQLASSDERPDGIISCVPHCEETKSAIVKAGVPFVGIGLSVEEFPRTLKNTGFVSNDNAGIGREAAKHLLSLGAFRSYAFIPDLANRHWSVIRGLAFKDALASHDKSCAIYKSASHDASALASFVKELPKPAAVLAAWDGRGADVIHAAHKAGLRIPDDIAILGVDDDDLVCEHTVPPLSSVKTDAEGTGEAAAQMLDRLMTGKTRSRPDEILRPILGITERSSTGTPSPASGLIERAVAFIKSEAANGISPDDVARYLATSRRLMDLRFKQYESKSVAELIAEAKLENAKRLLAKSEISVRDVFAQAGFGNIAYATRIFREATGSTPEVWRKSHATAVGEATGHRKAFEKLSALSDDDASALRMLAEQLTPDADFNAALLRNALANGTTEIFVLRRRTRITAAATAVRFATPTGSHCRIEDVVVDEKCRGLGLGRRIMVETLRALKAEGVASVELTSRPSRVAANALYRSIGFKRRRTNVYELKL